MYFGLLGPIYCHNDVRVVYVRSARQRVLLATLLFFANTVVTQDRLIEAIWSDDLPANPADALYTNVTRLRQTLGVGASCIGTRTSGYTISLECDQLDLAQARQLRDDGDQARSIGNWAEAAAKYQAGLKLWRGLPMSDLPSEMLQQSELPGLTELQLELLEGQLEAELQLGHHKKVLPQIVRLLEEHPYRERLHENFMLALYRDSRRAESLAAFQKVRQLLVNELGIEPGSALQNLHRQILSDDSELAANAPDRPGATMIQLVRAQSLPETSEAPRISYRRNGPVSTVESLIHSGLKSVVGVPGACDAEPSHVNLAETVVEPRNRKALYETPGLEAPTPIADLPASAGHFTGRALQIQAIANYVEGNVRQTCIISITGCAGVGKTALGLQWAHRNIDSFPDGQLYIDLNGHDVNETISSESAMRQMLLAMGRRGDDIPVEEAALRSRWRSALRQRKMLLFLDNAQCADQVLPLLPGASSTVVLVTSRNSMISLTTHHAVLGIGLEPLAEDESLELFEKVVGRQRTLDDKKVALAIIEHCGRLPLALRIAMSRISSQPGRPPSWLADELSNRESRLAALVTDDEARSVRAAFSATYHGLDPDAARMFRILGLCRGDAIDEHLLGVLYGGIEDATRSLRRLVSANLARYIGPHRVSMHELIRLYARECFEATESPDDRLRLIDRSDRWYLEVASTAIGVLRSERLHEPQTELSVDMLPFAYVREQILRWLKDELPNIVAVINDAMAVGRYEFARRLMWDLGPFYEGSLLRRS